VCPVDFILDLIYLWFVLVIVDGMNFKENLFSQCDAF